MHGESVRKPGGASKRPQCQGVKGGLFIGTPSIPQRVRLVSLAD